MILSWREVVVKSRIFRFLRVVGWMMVFVVGGLGRGEEILRFRMFFKV